VGCFRSVVRLDVFCFLSPYEEKKNFRDSMVGCHYFDTSKRTTDFKQGSQYCYVPSLYNFMVFPSKFDVVRDYYYIRKSSIDFR